MKSAQHRLAATRMPGITSIGIKRSGKTAWIYEPVIAPIVMNPKTLRIMSIFAWFQLGVTISGVWGWRCPVYSTIDIPCPGCGLSSALVLLIRGDWQTALSTHAFAPLVLIAILSMGILSLLPRSSYQTAVKRLAVLEAKSGLTGLLLIGFIGYWGLKFIF